MKQVLFSHFVAGFLAAKCIFWRFLSTFGDARPGIFKIFKNVYPNRKYLLMTRQMSPGNRASRKKLEKGHPNEHSRLVVRFFLS